MPKINIYPEQIGQATPQPLSGAADVRNAGAGFDALGQLAQQGADVMREVDRNRTAMETALATTEAAKAIEEQERYFLDEDTDYPTQTERYQNFYKDLEGQYREKFKNKPQAFNEWKRNVDQFAFKKGLNIKSSSMKKNMAEQGRMLESALTDVAGIAIRGDEEQYQQSIEKAQALIDGAMNSGVLTPGEAGQAKGKFQNELSRGKVMQDINNDPQKALDNIRANKYGSLSPEEQSQFEARAMSAVEQTKNRAKHELDKQSKELVSDTILSFENGYEVTDDELKAATAAAQITGQTEDLEVARISAKYITLPKATRDGLPEQLKGVDKAELRLGLEKADETIKRELDKDGYAFAVRQKVVEPVAIDISNPATIQARLEQVDYLKSHYGQPVSPLTNDEADTLVRALPNMTPRDKVALASALGSSEAVWAQLDKKNAGLFAMTGAIGDPVVMENVFKGQERLANKTATMPSQTDYLPAFDDFVGDVYAGRDRKAMMDAAIAYYAANSESDGFDSGDFEDAIEAVSGGIGKINGKKVELPRGVDEDKFEDFIDYFSAESVADYGGVWSMTNEQAAEAIQDGQLVNVGSGRYAVIYKGARLTKPNGGDFVIEFDQGKLERDSTAYRKSAMKKARDK